MNLKTRYLGFDLPHPFVGGAGPLAKNLDSVKRLEDAGSAAIQLYSLFEEQIVHHERGVHHHMEQYAESFAEATTYFPSSPQFIRGPEQYLEYVHQVKETVDVPVIASLNGVDEGAWAQYAELIEEAGADALEMNLYFLSHDENQTGADLEESMIRVVELVKKTVKIPVAVKIPPFFTSLSNFARRLAGTGVDGVVLFNRFYQPDIDIEELEIIPFIKLTTSGALRLRLRWLSVLCGRHDFNLAVTGGVHTAEDAVKALMVGSDCVQMVSAILKQGPDHIMAVKEGVANWMEEHEYESLDQMKGSMSLMNCPDPEAIERTNYMNILSSWKV